MITEKLIELGVDKDIAEKAAEMLNKEIDNLKAVHQSEAEALKKENENIKIGFEISKALSEAKVWSEKAVYSLIDFKNIRIDNDEVVGVREELERIRKECGILFKNTAAPRIIEAASSSLSDSESVMRTAMGI